MTKIDDVTAGDVMLTALAVLTQENLDPSFLEDVTPQSLLRGLAGTVHIAIGRYSIAAGVPMNEAAPILFNDLYREADGEVLPVLRQAFNIMAAVWREDAVAAADACENVAKSIHALMLLGQVLIPAEAVHLGVDTDTLAADYREQIMRMMANA